MTDRNKETIIPDEQQLTLSYILQNLASINMNLKSIATSLDKITSN